MAYDRTKTEQAALGLIDEENVVMCGALEVPYLAFRKSELRKIEELFADPDALFDYFYEIVNYRFKGTLPKEDFEDFTDLQKCMAYFIDNRGGQKKAVAKAETPLSPTSEPSTPTSSTDSPAS